MNRFLTLCAALLMAGAASCNGRPDTPQAQPADVQTVAAQADTAKFHVKTIDASLRGNATLKAIAANYAGKVVLIDFWATWCGPCMKLGPVVEELAEKYGDKAVIGKLNVDENDEVSTEQRVRNIPTVLFFKDGELKSRSVGFVGLDELEKHLLPLI